MWGIVQYKAKAVGIHLLFSLAAFAAAMAVILAWWYPGALFNIAGGWQGMRIMLLVDMVLGPLLTLVVMYPGKPRRALQFDIVVIAIFQISALLWGVYAVHSQRPVAVAWHDGAFHTAIAEDFNEQEDGMAQLKAVGERLPVFAFTAKPANADEATGVAAFKLLTGLEAWQLAFLYRPLPEHMADIRERRIPTKLLPAAASPERDWFRLVSRYGEAAITFDDNGKWVDSVIIEGY